MLDGEGGGEGDVYVKAGGRRDVDSVFTCS